MEENNNTETRDVNNVNVVDYDTEIKISSIFKVMFTRWKLLLAITFGVTLVGTLGINFVYNPLAKNYVVEFDYNKVPYTSNLIDGSGFTYTDLVTDKCLTPTKESKEEYSNIDLEKMTTKADNLSISVSYKYDETTEELLSTTYSLEIRAKLFDDTNQAKIFMMDLINYPINYNIDTQKKLDYKTNLTNYNNSDTYEEQISFISNQYSLVTTKYQEMINLYGDVTVSTTTNKGLLLSQIKNNIQTYFRNNSISDLSYELSIEGYTKSQAEIDKIKLLKQEYEKDIKYNKMKIEQLQDQVEEIMSLGNASNSYELDSYNSSISSLIQENVDLQRKIDDIDIKLEQLENDDDDYKAMESSFETKLSTYYQYLSTVTDNTKNDEAELLSTYSNVRYLNTNIIESDKDISLVLSIAIPFAIGFVCGLIVNIILDHKYVEYSYIKF